MALEVVIISKFTIVNGNQVRISVCDYLMILVLYTIVFHGK